MKAFILEKDVIDTLKKFKSDLSSEVSHSPKKLIYVPYVRRMVDRVINDLKKLVYGDYSTPEK